MGGQQVTSVVTHDLAGLPAFETEKGNFDVEVLVPSLPPDDISAVEAAAVVVIVI